MTKIKVMAEVLLQSDDGSVLLLKRPNSDTKRPGQWDVAGGHVDQNEDFHTAAIREVKEETGIEISKSDLELAYTITKPWDTSLSCTWLFFTAATTKQDPVLSNEHSDYEWVTLEQAIQHIEYDLQKNALMYIRDNHLL